MNISIKFEPLEELHFPLLLKWLEAPHVKKWWDQDVNYNMELIKEKYGSYVESYKLVGGVRKTIRGFIVYIDQDPIGYIQIYNLRDFSLDTSLENLPNNLGAFDIFIGEERFLRQGLGSKIIDKLLQLHADMYKHIFVNPDINNIAAIKSYENSGFQKISGGESAGEIWMLRESSLNKNLPSIIKKIAKYLAYSISVFLLAIMIFFLCSLFLAKKDMEDNFVTKYLTSKFSRGSDIEVTEIFKKIPEAKNGEKIIILGSEIENNILLPLEKKYEVIALDSKMIWFETVVPSYEKYYDQIKILNNWQITDLPKAKIIMANYILSFQDKISFTETWKELDQKLEINGYFIGSFLSKDSTIFPRECEDKTNFLSKHQLEELLENYQIISLKEIRNYIVEMNGEEVYYQVFAIKIR